MRDGEALEKGAMIASSGFFFRFARNRSVDSQYQDCKRKRPFSSCRFLATIR